MVRRDLARERLKEIRTLQGWREAYKVAGLDTQGDSDFSDPRKNATKRRRLSRLINRQTTGAKPLDSKQRRKINTTYRRPTRTRKLIQGRSDRNVKEINRLKAEARRSIRKIYGPNGTNPDPNKLRRRLARNRNLSAEEIERIEAAFIDAALDEGKAIRRSYASMVNKVPINLIPSTQQAEFRKKKRRADRKVWRDSGSQSTFEDWGGLSDSQKYGE